MSYDKVYIGETGTKIWDKGKNPTIEEENVERACELEEAELTVIEQFNYQ